VEVGKFDFPPTAFFFSLICLWSVVEETEVELLLFVQSIIFVLLLNRVLVTIFYGNYQNKTQKKLNQTFGIVADSQPHTQP
jgi:hypothetical protein